MIIEWFFFSLFSASLKIGSITVARKEIPWKAIFEHCRACWIFIIVTIDWDSSEDLVPEQTCESKAITGGRNWKDSYGTNGSHHRHRTLYEYGQYWLLCTTRHHHWQRNASVVTQKSHGKLICQSNKRTKTKTKQHYEKQFAFANLIHFWLIKFVHIMRHNSKLSESNQHSAQRHAATEVEREKERESGREREALTRGIEYIYIYMKCKRKCKWRSHSCTGNWAELAQWLNTQRWKWCRNARSLGTGFQKLAKIGFALIYFHSNLSSFQRYSEELKTKRNANHKRIKSMLF